MDVRIALIAVLGDVKRLPSEQPEKDLHRFVMH